MQVSCIYRELTSIMKKVLKHRLSHLTALSGHLHVACFVYIIVDVFPQNIQIREEDAEDDAMCNIEGQDK